MANFFLSRTYNLIISDLHFCMQFSYNSMNPRRALLSSYSTSIRLLSQLRFRCIQLFSLDKDLDFLHSTFSSFSYPKAFLSCHTVSLVKMSHRSSPYSISIRYNGRASVLKIAHQNEYFKLFIYSFWCA